MMESQVDRELLEKIADLIGKPVGAFNIRKDTGCDGRQSTENIQITGKTDGKSGIDIRIKDGTKGEQCHIPVIITKPGIQELVYNDFYIGENCDVDIVAGCGIHNCGGEDSRHDGIVGKTVRFLAQVCQTNRAGKNSFVPGRFAMTCCVQDIQFVGFPCSYDGYKALEQRAWVTVTAKVNYKFHNIYRGKGPVLTAISVEPAEKPQNDVVTFS